ncbi:peptidase S8 [Flavobacterium noncentrifugens]|uniref:Por secretion system C-terminal sorting domain-containing protein n=1 Tax=Flavobacterium noncentrifugens TaxID=1128970 RepID=A0A1G8YRZ0_9FLAO|nr:S8 family serine peptidase [Flavobacterium noncentrifugens]GEP51338.1 peptidase S8 [Flavobacterium noncentrifugens]SDK05561.1 Por secretion system C-terminal sorting domain-containing protein [Flavobacterium noncentrifugens]
MKKLAFLALFFIQFATFAQVEDAWVYLNAKPDSQQYLNNPLTMLTQRSLDRRATQNIALDFKDVPVYQTYIDQIEAADGISVMAKSKWLNALHIRGTQSQINALAALSFVTKVDFADKTLNGPSKNRTLQTINKVNKTMETASDFNYGNSLNQIQMLNGVQLHQQNYTGSGKIIAVMDGGFPAVNTVAPFARLRDNNQILGGYDYVNRNENFYAGLSHGTMVLSTMGGYVEGQLVGTAPDASYYLFITEDGNNEGPLEESLWVEAAEEADRLGVDIITTSLGYSVFDNTAYSHTYADMNGTTTFIARGLDIAYSRGMICVVSAGNEGSKPWHYITTPADALHALAIGAVNAQGNYASFSSYGPSSDGRVKPDVSAQGQASVLSNLAGNITTASGTSFSGPIMAGMIASLWQALPGKTNEEIMQLVKESASIYNSPNDQIGYGIPDFYDALQSTLGIQSFAEGQFLVYPNPVASVISIAFPLGFDNVKITLYNTLGQEILQKNITSQSSEIGVENLKSGIYLYQIESNGTTQKGKLIRK